MFVRHAVCVQHRSRRACPAPLCRAAGLTLLVMASGCQAEHGEASAAESPGGPSGSPTNEPVVSASEAEDGGNPGRTPEPTANSVSTMDDPSVVPMDPTSTPVTTDASAPQSPMDPQNEDVPEPEPDVEPTPSMDDGGAFNTPTAADAGDTIDADATEPDLPSDDLVAACEAYCARAETVCGTNDSCYEQCVEEFATGHAMCDEVAVGVVECQTALADEAFVCDGGAFLVPDATESCANETLISCANDNIWKPELDDACGDLCEREMEACELEGCFERCVEQYGGEVRRCGSTEGIRAYFDCLIAQPLDTWECAQNLAVSEQCLDVRASMGPPCN